MTADSLIVVRSGGDIATGTIQKLRRSGVQHVPDAQPPPAAAESAPKTKAWPTPLVCRSTET